MTYSRKRHLKLLQRSQNFKSRGQFYRESPDESLEFGRYQGAIQSYIDWRSPHTLALLMNKFVNRTY